MLAAWEACLPCLGKGYRNEEELLATLNAIHLELLDRRATRVGTDALGRELHDRLDAIQTEIGERAGVGGIEDLWADMSSLLKELRSEARCVGVAGELLGVPKRWGRNPFQRRLVDLLASERALFEGMKTAYEARIRETSRQLLCVVCMRSTRDTLLLPCAHLVVCGDCLQSCPENAFQSCPVCRTNVEQRLRVYL